MQAKLECAIVAAVINYYKFGGLKQHKFVILQLLCHKSEIGLTGLKSRFQQSPVPSRGFRREICFLNFPNL